MIVLTYKQRETLVSFSTLIFMNANLITLQPICHANHAITKFQHILTAHNEKSFSCHRLLQTL